MSPQMSPLRRAAQAAALIGLVVVLAGLSAQVQDARQTIDSQRFAARELAVQVGSLATVEGRVIDLPEVGQAWYLSIFVDPAWETLPAERDVVSWFSTEPRLVNLRAQTHDRMYTTDDPLYLARYATVAPKTPAVMLQDPDGKVHYKAGGDVGLPANGGQLADKLQNLFERWPCPKPKPDPKPGPDLTPDMPEIPDIDVPGVLPLGGPTTAMVVMVGLALFVVGGGVSLLYNIKNQG